MTKQIPSYLKLVTDTSREASCVAAEDLAALTGVAQAFEQATGWRLELEAANQRPQNTSLMWSAPVNPGVGKALGHIRLISSAALAAPENPGLPLAQAALVADAVGTLWGELVATRQALCQREAELAAGVPVVLRDDEHAPPLSERLEAVLRGGAQAIGCDAVALYLLDPATTELKLRASWGLPKRRLTQPARQLRGALADLEALLGHAVVLTDDDMHEYWKVPERGYAACVCVPVSSPSMPLGTLWAFSRAPREFDDAQTQILEVVAGRVSSDLEREVLVDEAVHSRQQTRQVREAQHSQSQQLPTIAPHIDAWQVAGKAHHAGAVGGTFFDWFALDDGSLSVLAADAVAGGVAGALTAAALRAAGRACALRRADAAQLLPKANGILWTSSGSECAGLFQAILAPNQAGCSFAIAGPLRVLAIAGGEATVLAGPTTPLGWQEELRPEQYHHEPAAGELLVVYGTSFLADCDETTLATLDTHLATCLESSSRLSAEKLCEIVHDTLRAQPGIDDADQVALVIKRRASRSKR